MRKPGNEESRDQDSSKKEPIIKKESIPSQDEEVQSYSPKEATLYFSVKDKEEQVAEDQLSNPDIQSDIPSYTSKDAEWYLDSKEPIGQPTIELSSREKDAGVKTENGVRLLIIVMIVDFIAIIILSSTSFNLIIPLIIFEGIITLGAMILIYMDRKSFNLAHEDSVETGMKFYMLGFAGKLIVKFSADPMLTRSIATKTQSPNFSLANLLSDVIIIDILWALFSTFTILSLYYFFSILISVKNKKILALSVASAIAVFYISALIDIVLFIKIVPIFDEAFYNGDLNTMNAILAHYSQLSKLYNLIGLIADSLLIYSFIMVIDDLHEIFLSSLIRRKIEHQ